MINIKRNRMNCFQMYKKILFIVLKCLRKLKMVIYKLSAGMVHFFRFLPNGAKIMITQECVRMLIRSKVSMHCETVVLMSRVK